MLTQEQKNKAISILAEMKRIEEKHRAFFQSKPEVKALVAEMWEMEKTLNGEEKELDNDCQNHYEELKKLCTGKYKKIFAHFLDVEAGDTSNVTAFAKEEIGTLTTEMLIAAGVVKSAYLKVTPDTCWQMYESSQKWAATYAKERCKYLSTLMPVEYSTYSGKFSEMLLTCELIYLQTPINLRVKTESELRENIQSVPAEQIVTLGNLLTNKNEALLLLKQFETVLKEVLQKDAKMIEILEVCINLHSKNELFSNVLPECDEIVLRQLQFLEPLSDKLNTLQNQFEQLVYIEDMAQAGIIANNWLQEWLSYENFYKQNNIGGLTGKNTNNQKLRCASQISFVQNAYTEFVKRQKGITDFNNNVPTAEATIVCAVDRAKIYAGVIPRILTGEAIPSDATDLDNLIQKLKNLKSVFDVEKDLKEIIAFSRDLDFAAEIKKMEDYKAELTQLATLQNKWKAATPIGNGVYELDMKVSLTSKEPTNPVLDNTKGTNKVIDGADGAHFDDITQGAIGDCYFLSGLAAITSKDANFVSNTIKTNTDKNTGDVLYYQVRMYLPIGTANPREEVWIKVEPKFVQKTNTKLKYAQQGDSGELWPAIIEAAFALIKDNGYQGINQGRPEEAFAFLNKTSLSDMKVVFLDDAKELFKIKKEELKNENLSDGEALALKFVNATHATISSKKESALAAVCNKMPLSIGSTSYKYFTYKTTIEIVPQHAYTILDMDKTNCRLYNPHGYEIIVPTADLKKYFEDITFIK